MLSLIAFSTLLFACDGAAPEDTPATITAPITNGQLDGDAHPYVGLALFGYNSEEGVELWWRCSGALISEYRFLTAGHCAYSDGVVPNVAIIFFAPDLTAVLAGLEAGYLVPPYVVGTPFPHPEFADFAGFPNTHDVATVELWWSYPVSRYASVAAPGTVDTYLAGPSADEFLEGVGYGLQAVGNKVKPDQAEWIRMVATQKVVPSQGNLTGGWNIQTADTPRALPRSVLADPDRIPYASGGTCFGDSGGPQLLPGTDIIVAVTSFGLNGKCAGTGFHYRVDTATAQDFIFGADQ